MELEWKNRPGITKLQILAEVQNMMTELKCDIAWREKGNKEMCIATSLNVADYARKFAHGHLSFLEPGSEKKKHGTHTYKPGGEWDRAAEDMMIDFSEGGHPVFLGSSALERRTLKRKKENVHTFLW